MPPTLYNKHTGGKYINKDGVNYIDTGDKLYYESAIKRIIGVKSK